MFAVTTWPVYARTTRSVVLVLRNHEFVQAARGLGAGDHRILWRHLLPGIVSPALVLGSFEVARMIILEAALGFLGLGVQPPTPTWGNMLADGRDYLRDAWWIAHVSRARHHDHRGRRQLPRRRPARHARSHPAEYPELRLDALTDPRGDV